MARDNADDSRNLDRLRTQVAEVQDQLLTIDEMAEKIGSYLQGLSGNLRLLETELRQMDVETVTNMSQLVEMVEGTQLHRFQSQGLMDFNETIKWVLGRIIVDDDSGAGHYDPATAVDAPDATD